MQLNNQHIDEYIAMYQKRYGVRLSREKAHDSALRLCRLVEIVVLDDKKEETYDRPET